MQKEEPQAVNSDKTKKIERAEENKNFPKKEEPTQKEQERSAENEQVVQITLERKSCTNVFCDSGCFDRISGYRDG